MQSKIRVLDEHTINKIAAGEVIENPASVIKELVENSLDAGATDIYVEIRGGGRQLIRITDNGCGMSGDDAILCLERHATSKIRAVEDIHELMTMGFRGEAIPSIASISKFSILTRPHGTGNTEGTMVLVEGGKILKSCPAACSAGTTIEVKSLFFNVPVRKKFQKSPTHDANEILKTMTLLALGYPHIKFRLVVDHNTLISAPAPAAENFLGQLQERVGAVLGGSYIEGCLPIEGCEGEYRIQGWIGRPYHHRPNRTGQYLFINQRGIQSPLVSFAVKDGYGTTLPAQRHPLYVLHLSMPGALVDVNVHPQKREVRLRQEALLREMILTAVRRAIQKEGGTFHTSLSTPMYQDDSSFPLSAAPPPPLAVKPVFTPLPVAEYRYTHSVIPSAPPPIAKEAEFVLEPSKPSKQTPKVIASIPGYLILESTPEGAPLQSGGLCLLDQRAAHARVVFEQLLLHKEKKSMNVQSLLIPHTIELSAVEAETLKLHLGDLEALGIPIKEFGRHTFLLDALPDSMGNLDPAAFIHEVVAGLGGAKEAASGHMERSIALAAIRSSVSKERRLSSAEGQSLVRQLFECETPWYCPQGRPTMAVLSPEQISKHFQ